MRVCITSSASPRAGTACIDLSEAVGSSSVCRVQDCRIRSHQGLCSYRKSCCTLQPVHAAASSTAATRLLVASVTEFQQEKSSRASEHLGGEATHKHHRDSEVYYGTRAPPQTQSTPVLSTHSVFSSISERHTHISSGSLPPSRPIPHPCQPPFRVIHTVFPHQNDEQGLAGRSERVWKATKIQK